MLLGFVPARGGSKGIPRKNLISLAGKPLIHYTLEAARACSSLDDLLLSTDDEEIAACCAAAGVTTPYRRPPELASDEAPMLAALEHALAWYARATGREPEVVALLQPTSPLRAAEDIDGAVAAFRRDAADTLASAHPLAEHPSECVIEETAGWRYLVAPPADATRRQDYRGRYSFINGAIYLARVAVVRRERRLVIPGRTLLYQMPRERGIDVDTLTDLAHAEALLHMRGGQR
jgi:CMP-N,N'-diacetyllegionaminic acid synthase